MSSAKSNYTSLVNVPHLMPIVMSDVVFFMIQSMTMIRSVYDITQPCLLTPALFYIPIELTHYKYISNTRVVTRSGPVVLQVNETVYFEIPLMD